MSLKHANWLITDYIANSLNSIGLVTNKVTGKRKTGQELKNKGGGGDKFLQQKKT